MQKESAKAPPQSQPQEIRAVIAAFSALLLQETAALKKSDFKAVDALQAEKRRLAKSYNDKIQEFAARKDALAALEQNLRQQMQKEHAQFSALVRDNARALELAQNSARRLVNRILEVARSAVMEERQTNYSGAGLMQSYKSSSMSLAVDRSL